MGNLFMGLSIGQMPASDTNQVNSLIELLMKGGFIMIPIVLLSILSIYLFIERYIYIKKVAVIDENLLNNVLVELRGGNSDRALIHTRSNSTSIGRILGIGVEKIGKPVKEIESQMESITNLEISLMEKDTGYLGIIAGVAPMLGFIGTISGVIKIFYNISLSDNISIGIIAGGLYQKMICSGTGLIVGVIAYSCYHILQMMIDRFSIKLQRQAFEFIKAI
ncbi:MAG: MotA/TolQ/ExbB proton channel family protein [Bacteroidales bacterium]|jgi:biopolymer transport protein ExbB